MARKIIGKETIYKIADLYSSGTSYTNIAKECELSITTVMKYINKMIDRGELIKRTGLRPSRESRELVDKFVNGATIKRLAEDYSISVAYIYRCINVVEKSTYTSDDYKIKIAKRKQKYTNTYNADQILKDYMNPNLSVMGIAAKHGISEATVYAVVSESGLPKRKNRINDQEFINKLKELYYANKTYKEIGIELGISAKVVYNYVKKLMSLGYIEKREVKHRTSTRSAYSSSKLYSIVNMYNEGVPTREIAESAGISLAKAYSNIRKAKEMGLIERTKLTPSRKLMQEIVDKFVNGTTARRLAEDYSISAAYIYKCINDVEKSAYTSDDYKLKIAKRKQKYTNTYNVDKILEDYMNPNLTVIDIVAKHGISTSTLNSVVSKSGLPKRKNNRIIDQKFINKLKELYYANKTYKEIGIELGISDESVYNYVKKLISLGYIEKRRLTIRSNKRNIVRKLYRENKSVKEISNITGLHVDSIYKYTRDFRKGRYHRK